MTYNIDERQIREYLAADSARVVGIIPVHLYGQACNMDEVMQIAKEYNLFVLEDVAQAFGGDWKGSKLGSIGTTGAFSFFPSKNLGGFGDGGMVATHDEEMVELVRMLLKHGGKDKYNVDHIGYNARLDTLQAAIVLAKFKYIDEFNQRRRNVAKLYNERFSDLEGLSLPLSFSHVYHVYHQYTIRVDNGKRDDLQQFLNENGVSTMIYYPVPLHKMGVFTGRCKVLHQAEQSKKAVQEVLSLPIEPLMEEEDLTTVVKTVRSYFTE